MKALWDILAVGLGGAAGTLLRHGIELRAQALSLSIPAVAGINILGAFMIGLWMTLLLERAHLSPRWRLLLTTGLLGGFTTFGTLMAEGGGLMRQGDVAGGLVLIGGEVLLGLLATLFGMSAARLLRRQA